MSRSASRSASCAASISSMRLRRSAISVSRAVNTRSSSVAAWRAPGRPRPAPRTAPSTAAATAIARCCSASSIALRRSISSAWISRSRADPLLLDRPLRGDARAARSPRATLICARSASCSFCARSRATSARCAARASPRARAPASSRAYSRSRSMSSAWLLGLQVLVADLDHRVLLDVVPHLLARARSAR